MTGMKNIEEEDEEDIPTAGHGETGMKPLVYCKG